ncbi:MAG: Uma2 family endonuclease [Verrucomicrobia bacterium]|nr:Uma2 family endonuclease [Verrucomicrobiota bacterium]
MKTAVLETPQTYEEERGKPMPSKNHGIVQSNLVIEFARHKEYRVISELSLVLNGRQLTPDLSVYPRGPVDFRHDDIRLTDPPLVAVEIPSPTQGSQEVMDKVEAYLQSGVKTCWVVNPPQRTVTIYTPDGVLKSFVEGLVKDPATGLTADLEAVFS